MGWTTSITLSTALSLLATSLVRVDAACPGALTPNVPAPVVAKGYKVSVIANGLSSPRSIMFDSAGHMLVVEQYVGIRAMKMKQAKNGCVSTQSSKVVVSDSSLNHGIELSANEKHLFASSDNTVFRWDYNPKTAEATSRQAIITNMTNSDHTTRTLLLSKKKPGTLVVSRGSADNIDPASDIKSTGHSQVKAFNLFARGNKIYDFVGDGKILGWGLRNEVGLAEHPVKGGIWGVENSADNIQRLGKDIHEDNPGEELNYFGTLVNNKSPNQGRNFGYPDCFSAWKVSDIPQNSKINVGTQFSLDPSKITDAECRKRVAPRLTFQAHSAPLSIMFDKPGTHAWVTFHGSWDRSTPAGYAVARIAFENGHPKLPHTSTKAAEMMVTNLQAGSCPGNCFRPVGLAQDTKGRIFFSSDQTGEIYMITKA